jgi:hypothetical protein
MGKILRAKELTAETDGEERLRIKIRDVKELGLEFVPAPVSEL